MAVIVSKDSLDWGAINSKISQKKQETMLIG